MYNAFNPIKFMDMGFNLVAAFKYCLHTLLQQSCAAK
jgi:hypothetical protein